MANRDDSAIVRKAWVTRKRNAARKRANAASLKADREDPASPNYRGKGPRKVEPGWWEREQAKRDRDAVDRRRAGEKPSRRAPTRREEREALRRKGKSSPKRGAKKPAPKSLSLSEATEGDKTFRTGRPVKFDFVRNTEGAPKAGPKDRFQQKIEPAGKYLSHASVPGKPPKGWVRGTAEFKNPLVLEWSGSGSYDTSSWKARLAKAYGKTGVALTRALIRDGYDGIVTTDKYGTAEIVSLKNGE